MTTNPKERKEKNGQDELQPLAQREVSLLEWTMEELKRHPTPMLELSLKRVHEQGVQTIRYELKTGTEQVANSLVTSKDSSSRASNPLTSPPLVRTPDPDACRSQPTSLETVLHQAKHLTGRMTTPEDHNLALTQKVIVQRQTESPIRESLQRGVLMAEPESYFELHSSNLSLAKQEEAVQALKVADIVQRYGFQRFVPPTHRAYPSRVISMKELQEHPEEYWHKLSKGIFSYAGLDLSVLNRMREALHAEKIFWNKDGSVGLNVGNMLNNTAAGLALVPALKFADLNRGLWDNLPDLEPTDFLANYQPLVRYIADQPALPGQQKQQAIAQLSLVRMVYLSALELTLSTEIKDTSELLHYSPTDEHGEKQLVPFGEERLKRQLWDCLLAQPVGTSFEEIQKLLPIRSRERFRSLAAERTAEMLREPLLASFGKELRDYTVGESLVLASYFARYIITQYATLNDQVKATLEGGKNSAMEGKCTDYTGLALHYLREYLIPLHPEKFRNWRFGFDSTIIGDYKHCYIKAMHINPDYSIDLFYVDPTDLAAEGLAGLTTPKKVLQHMDTSRHPILIDRDAEDLLAK